MKAIDKIKDKSQRQMRKHAKEIRKMLKNEGAKVSAKIIYYT
ncbi:MAG: hypothetical protein PHF86_01280 [Candidatus Nanoarchaeia archaeon]|nr:hypothetical protein [Candidatus Nanoarchaeia archaeon]